MKNIFVTQPSLPPIEDFTLLLEKIWDNKHLTNGGEFHAELELKLADFLGVKYISLFANGTIALLTALQALEISGEVITTPYTFVATSNVLWWNRTKPIFVDIDKKTCNIDVDKIEVAITPETSAILPVHVYGNPCDVEAIQKIADKHKLKVIYDAAHAFGVKSDKQSILNFGDLSILSFHATKVFNTAEGGAIISHTEKMKKHIDNLKNFGILNDTTVVAPGINGKMNEIQAALGLLNLKTIDSDISGRKKIAQIYQRQLQSIKGIAAFDTDHIEDYNYGYFPIFVDKKEFGLSRDELFLEMKKQGVFGRRYFFPPVSDFPMYRSLKSASIKNLSVCHEVSNSVICLPIYPDMEISEVEFVIYTINQVY